MRDVLLAVFLLGSIPVILWRPVVGVFLWIWVSVMNPHRLTWGFAYDLQFAQYVAIATLVGILFSTEPKRLPLTPVTVVLFVMAAWMSVTTYFAIDTSESLPMFERVMKIMFMVFVALFILHSKQHVQVLIWILAGSVAFYGVKGGLFTLRTAGEYLVWGPSGSFIEENNALALATIMTIPLLYYLFLQATKRWVRWALLATMVLCGFSALGSHSRGGFLAITAMIAILWWNSHKKLVTGFVLVLLIPLAIGFMPDKWEDRMRSIENYEQDNSAMGRINAWGMAWNLAMDRPLGGGYEIYNLKVFGRYAPDPTYFQHAHSIYFQMLGEHGFVGLGLFLLLWLLAWRDASWITRQARSRHELRWADDLARMIQVSLVGYAVGGAFLSLAYYDVPYNLLIALVVTRLLVEKEIKSADQSTAGAPQMNEGGAGSRQAVTRSRFGPHADAGRRG